MAKKVILITGCSRGIGLATANYLLRASSNICVLAVARTAAPLEELKAQYPNQVEFVIGDVASPRLAQKAVESALIAFGKAGQLDGLVVNHAALGAMRRIENCSVQEWKEVFDTNFFSVVELIQAALPHLRKSKGRIILTSSGASVKGYSSWGAYGSSKAALNHLALTLANEEKDIVSIAVRPGIVDTAMQTKLREEHVEKFDEVDKEKFSNAKTKGELLRPEQPGNVIARLVLDSGKDLSGKFLSWNDSTLAAFQD